MANLYGYLQLPPAQLHQFKAAGIGSPAAGVIFWQSHEPSSSQQFYTRCLYKHGLFCLPCVHGQGHNCKTDYLLSHTTRAGKKAAATQDLEVK